MRQPGFRLQLNGAMSVISKSGLETVKRQAVLENVSKSPALAKSGAFSPEA
jgi:hypothetical protein